MCACVCAAGGVTGGEEAAAAHVGGRSHGLPGPRRLPEHHEEAGPLPQVAHTHRFMKVVKHTHNHTHNHTHTHRYIKVVKHKHTTTHTQRYINTV